MKTIRLVAMLRVLPCLLLLNVHTAYALDHTTVKAHPERWFSTGWSHVIDTPSGIFWYNSQNGSGVLGKLDREGNHTSFKTNAYAKGWTHIVSTPHGVLWYNSQTGAGTIGRFDSAGNYTSTKTLSFSKGWTHVVSTPEGLVWYNAKTGAAVIGRLE